MNIVRDLLKSGKTVVGTAGRIDADMATMADAGWDFLLYDSQHSPVEVKQMLPSIQSIIGKKALPIIRVSGNQPDVICFALDVGAMGVVVPMVNTKEEAEALVRAAKYAPLGDRSHAGPRGQFGEAADYRSYLDMVNEEIILIPMIETQQAVDNIDEILSVPGIDVALIGPTDLSIELNSTMDFQSPAYEAALDKIAASCKRHGVVPGMYFIPPAIDPNWFVDKGYKFFTMQSAGWVTEGIQNGLSKITR
jgi:4-hydroxy-2-oxoheptanedioate aldolase